MTMISAMRSALTGVRRHPMRAAAFCVPVVAACVFTGTTMASARPDVSLAVPAAELNAVPPPHVLLFDNHLTGKVARVKPGAVIKLGWNVDGCDHDYAAPNVCVPWAVPGSTPQGKCAWLKSNGFGQLKVYGRNRQDLPENAKGYVCS